MRKYVVMHKTCITDSDITEVAQNEDVCIVWAKNKFNAIKRYLYLEFELEPMQKMKNVIFRHWLEDIYYDDYELYETFKRAKEIRRMAEWIYLEYFSSTEIDPEDLFCHYETNEMCEKYWNLLTLNERRTVYAYCYRYDVYCSEVVSIKKRKSEVNKTKKNKRLVLTTLAKLIVRDKKNYYQLNIEVLKQTGISKRKAKRILQQLALNNDNIILTRYDEYGNFEKYSLISYMGINWNDDNEIESIDIYPTEFFVCHVEEILQAEKRI